MFEQEYLEACKTGDVAKIHVLSLQGFTDFSYKNNQGLLNAAAGDHIRVLHVIISYASVKQTENNQGCPAIILALNLGHVEFAQIILRNLLISGYKVDKKIVSRVTQAAAAKEAREQVVIAAQPMSRDSRSNSEASAELGSFASAGEFNKRNSGMARRLCPTIFGRG